MIVTPLTDVETVALPAVERFIAADRIRYPNQDGVNATATPAFIGQVLFGCRQRELSVPKVIIAWSHLPEAVRPGSRKPTALAHFWQLLCAQPEGEDGLLLADDGTYNVFQIQSSFTERERIVLAYVHFRSWVLDSPDRLEPRVARRARFFWTLKTLSS